MTGKELKAAAQRLISGDYDIVSPGHIKSYDIHQVAKGCIECIDLLEKIHTDIDLGLVDFVDLNHVVAMDKLFEDKDE